MSKLIASLLGIDDLKFKGYIDRLEHVALRPGVDIRLTVDVITQVRNKVRALDLDVNDTTPKELFYALKHRLVADDKKLANKLGLEARAVEANTKKIALAASRVSGREMSLSLTTAGTKRILKAVPPKKTLKVLKYRSLDSVLKRNDPRILYALACLIENDSWHAQVYAKIKRLDVRDVQWQPVSTLPVPASWYEKVYDVVSQKGAFVINEEAGVVCLLPVIDRNKHGSTVLLLGLALQAATHIATQSLPYKRQAMTHGFSNILSRIATADHPELSSIHGLNPSWRTVHELLGAGHVSLGVQEPEFEPFDLFWESTEAKLASLVESMDFWVGTHFVGAKAVRHNPVSLHVLDVATTCVGGLEFGGHPYAHMRTSLWNELQLRYLQEEVLAKSLIAQLSKTGNDMLP